MAGKRSATITRETGETKISVTLSLDGTGKSSIKTGSRMFDHMLDHVCQHGIFDIIVKAKGWDEHHLAEDVAIALGQALNKALSDKKGIVRMSHAIVPMDEALATVVIDLSGRGYAVLDLDLKNKKIGDMESDMIRHFLETFAIEGKMNLHAQVLYGANEHHKLEALFKALGRALGSATRIDPRIAGKVPSTKGKIEG